MGGLDPGAPPTYAHSATAASAALQVELWQDAPGTTQHARAPTTSFRSFSSATPAHVSTQSPSYKLIARSQRPRACVPLQLARPPTHRASNMADRIIYAGLVVSQVLTFAAYAVVTAGAALLQQKANTLTIFDDPASLDAVTKLYNDVFTSTTYIIPYPQQPQYQFQYEWWIIEFELFVFLLTATCTVFPSIIPRLRPVALTFIASALVLVMDNINAIFFLLRNDVAMQVFEGYRIKTAQAGLLMVGCANFMTIFFLGMYNPHHAQEQQAAETGSVAIKANAV